jgi:hypothetical protein
VEEVAMGWRTVSAALDVGTATCAAANATYFVDRLLAGVDRPLSRRLALLALAVVSLAALVEALALLAVAARSAAVPLTSAPWALVRVLPFAGAGGISALIFRRVVYR